jgi:hypothetical protein
MLESPAVGETLRAVLAAGVFAILVLGAADQRPVERIGWNPDLVAPGYPDFIEEVARRTAAGETIAIVVPMRSWSRGQEYAYYRATYLLPGRRVLPLVDPDDTTRPERLREARYVAVWKADVPAGPFERVWAGHGGTLLRRRP